MRKDQRPAFVGLEVGGFGLRGEVLAERWGQTKCRSVSKVIQASVEDAVRLNHEYLSGKMLTIDLATLEHEALEEFGASFRPNKSVRFVLPFTLDGSQSSRDVIYDHALVMLGAERLAQHGKVLASGNIWRQGSHPAFHVDLVVSDESGLTEVLLTMITWFSSTVEETEDELMERHDTVETFHEQVDFHMPLFPELMDDYYANLVHGAIPAMASDEGYEDTARYIRDHFAEHPEYMYGFWYSATGRSKGHEFLVSTDSWIIPGNQPRDEILNSHSGVGPFVLQPAQRLMTERGTMFTNGKQAHPMLRPDTLERAAACGLMLHPTGSAEVRFEMNLDGNIAIGSFETFTVIVFLQEKDLPWHLNG